MDEEGGFQAFADHFYGKEITCPKYYVVLLKEKKISYAVPPTDNSYNGVLIHLSFDSPI